MSIKIDENKTITTKSIKLRLMKDAKTYCYLQIFNKKLGLWIDILSISPSGQIRRCDEIPNDIGIDKCVDGKVYIS